MFRVLLAVVLAVVVFVVGGYFLPFLSTEELSNVGIEEEKKDQVLEPAVKKEVIKSKPLLVVRDEVKIETSILTVGGVISWTNFFRQTNNFTVLKENNILNSIASSKLEDILGRQYFEHVSPSGEGAGDIANKFGYKFVLIGENLAMGDFKDDEDVVKAWMNSPGHRANILKPAYIEIGVATKKGFFNGREVWVSVQIFAVPLSFCDSPDENILVKIESNKIQLKSNKEHLDFVREIIEKEKYQSREEYESLVAEYNSLVPSYNFLSQNTKSLVEQYNLEVSLFNQCVASIE
ncbi:MAG TPA: CAP domain-containing protein [Candidatus Paceibacterota bacterium]